MSVQVSQSYTHRLDVIEEVQLCRDLDCGSYLPHEQLLIRISESCKFSPICFMKH